MSFIAYVNVAFWVFIVSLFPVGGMYVAIPMGIVLGLDLASVLIFAILGAYIPIVIVSYFYTALIRLNFFYNFQSKLYNDHVRSWLSRWSRWIVLASLPFFNGWIVGLFARSAGLKRYEYLPQSLATIAILALFQSALIYLVSWAGGLGFNAY